MKRFISLFLALVLALSLAWGVVPAYAEEDVQDTSPQIEQTPEDNSVTEASYPMDAVNQDLMVSHTDKTSELKTEDNQGPNYPKGDDAVNLSCAPGVYDAMGWTASELTSKAQSYAEDESNQNPLAGYSFVAPEELMVGFANRDSNHYVTEILTINDQSGTDPVKLNDDIFKLETAAGKLSWTEGENDQTHTGIGVDMDGDGTDEFAYLTLYQSGSEHSCLKVELFDFGNGSWTKKCEKNWDMDDPDIGAFNKDDYILGIEVAQSRGYTAMAAGNFDHDSKGTEELAVYLPDRDGGDKSPNARVAMLRFENGSLEEKSSIYLKDINADYGDMGVGWHLPTVSLSTSTLRLGSPTETKGAYHYDPYTDLVINVSVPKEYQKKGLDLNSTTAICELDGDLKKTNMTKFEYTPWSNQRMTAVNSCLADLNGDGYKELVVAGVPETGLGSNNTDYGSFSNDHSLVNLIYYTGSEYRMVWEHPKEVAALKTLDPDDFNSLEPISLCAGHYDPDTPAERDQLFILGVFFRCDGALITGPANYVNADSTYCIMTNTSPYKENLNFPEGDVTLTNISEGFNVPNEVGAEGDAAWINSCASGFFLTDTGTESVVMVTSDKRDGKPDEMSIDVSIASLVKESGSKQWKAKEYNDLLKWVDEDDFGTSMYVCFLNSDDDSYYYRYTGTYSSWSAPVLFSVVQVPPYYREANGITNIQFDITSGITDNNQFNFGVGLNVSYAGQVKIPLIGVFGTQSSIGGNVGCSHAWSSSKTVTNVIRLWADQDYAVAYVVPVLVNTYDILKASQVNDPNAEPDYYEVREPLDPIFTALSIDQYNAALANNEEHNDVQLPADYSAPRITADMLAKSRAGDPLVYENDVDVVIQAGPKEGDPQYLSVEDKKDELATDKGTAVNSQGPSMGSTLALGSSATHSGSVTGNISLGYVIGAEVLGQSAKVTPSFTATAGYTNGQTTSSTVKYTVLYNGISKTMPYGVAFDSGDSRYDWEKVDSQIIHYDPTAQTNALNYNYTATAVAYPLGNYKTDLDLLRGTNPEDMDPNFTIYELSFATSSYDTPPEPPLNFALQSARINSEDGSADITLAWDSTVRNEARKPAGYNIYMLNVQKQDESTNTIYLQNDEGPIPRNTDGHFTTYTMHLENLDYAENPVFYIAPVFKKLEGGMLKVTEGVLSGKYELNLTALTEGAITITKQPQSVYFDQDAVSKDAVFTVSATTPLSSKMDFDWQLWNRTAGKWESVKADGSHSITNTPSGTPTDSEFQWKDAQTDVPVRCIITCGNNSVQSAKVSCQYKLDPKLALAGSTYKTYDKQPAKAPRVYTASDATPDTAWYQGGTKLNAAPVNAGSYTFKVTVPETEIYQAGELSEAVTIAPIQPAVTLSAGQDSTAATVTATVGGLLEADGSVTFTVKKDGAEPVSSTVQVTEEGGSYQATLSGEQVAGGRYTVQADYTSASGNYSQASAEANFNKDLEQRTVTVADVPAKKVGDPAFQLQAETDKPAESPNADVWSYAVTADTWEGYDLAGAAAEPTVTVSDTGEVTVNHAGTAIIQVTLTDKNGVYDKATDIVTVDVEPLPLTVASFADPDAAAYGKAVTYGLTYTQGSKTLEDFTPDVGTLSAVPVTGDASKTPYPVEIAQETGKLTYNGTEYDVFLCRDYDLTLAPGELTVKVRALTDDVEISTPKDVTYTGQEQKQSVTLTTKEGVVLTEEKDYTLTYTDNLIGPGAVKVTATGMGNYSGTLTTSYQILEAENNGGNNGGGSGGGGGAADPAANPVSVPASAAAHGSVKSSAANARAGDKVTLTVTPDEGYALDQLTVTDAKGNVIEVTKNADGTYSFIMPDSEVKIAAAFVEAAVARRFVDVAEDAFYAEAVAWAVERGVTTGTDETHFSPNAPCTRAHMVTFLWRAAGSPEPAETATQFLDVRAGSYYEKAVAWAVENGITNGVDETHFAPGDTVTRAQTVAFLYRYAKAHAEPAAVFDDVSPEAWYAEAVAWAAEKGITRGVDETRFAPGDDCTRGQIVTFLHRCFTES